MTETITVRGFLGGEVEEFITPQGLPISNFRLGCTPRRYDRKTERWVNGDTNWYSVSAFRQLAQNVKSSLSKGDPVLVTGRLRVRQWENDKGQRGTSVEIDAEAIGYDLTFGSGSFTRLGGSGSGEDNPRSTSESNSEANPESNPQPNVESNPEASGGSSGGSPNGSPSSAADTVWDGSAEASGSSHSLHSQDGGSSTETAEAAARAPF